MIHNFQYLNEKELELTNLIVSYLEREGFGIVEPFVGHSFPHEIEFKNDLVRLIAYISPEEENIEEQLRIHTIIFDSTMVKKGLFKKLLDELVKYCNKHKNMPIVFTDVVSEPFKQRLLKYNGRVLSENFNGYNIVILPEEYN